MGIHTRRIGNAFNESESFGMQKLSLLIGQKNHILESPPNHILIKIIRLFVNLCLKKLPGKLIRLFMINLRLLLKNMINLNKIKKIAKDVYKSLGSGFSEDVYDKSMQVGLRLAKMKYESQRAVELKYKDHYVGEGYPDIIIGSGKSRIILELKAVGGSMGASEKAQIKGYMKRLKIKHGLLINFQQPKKEGKTQLEIKEVKI